MGLARLELQLDEIEARKSLGLSMSLKSMALKQIAAISRYMHEANYEFVESTDRVYELPRKITITAKDASRTRRDIERLYDDAVKKFS